MCKRAEMRQENRSWDTGLGLRLVSEDKDRKASISHAGQHKDDCREAGDHLP